MHVHTVYRICAIVFIVGNNEIGLDFYATMHVTTIVMLAVLFVVFLILSKWYTLRERNREINIQAIVEDHYERYMDQEEEYMRQCRQK